jgi:RNA polymerase sigma-70 factor (ECF subfamily)
MQEPEKPVQSAEDPAFDDLIRRMRAGDQAAATQLVQQYEPAIRRVVRIQLRNPRLRRLLDSVDICQSVLGTFFVRAALGQYELRTPEQLLKLLANIARHKLADQVKQHQRGRRDHRRVESGSPDERAIAATQSSPSEQVAFQELLDESRKRLSEEERYLADQRALGRGWDEIAAECGGSPEALRKKLTRAIERIGRELGLEDVCHE